MTLDEIFAAMRERFKPGVADKRLSFYFSLGEGAKYTVFVDAQAVDVQTGRTTERADCVLKTDPAMFQKMVLEGYEPGVMEFMSGKVKSNDPFLLKTFKACFRTP